MRLNIRKSIITGISLATLLPAFSLLQSCDDSEAEKWVDLRYSCLLYTSDAADD